VALRKLRLEKSSFFRSGRVAQPYLSEVDPIRGTTVRWN
jgi:hypothetical protein